MSVLTRMNCQSLTRARTKQAEEIPTFQDRLRGQLRMEAIKDILAAGLLAGTLGAGARTALGSSYLFGRPTPDLNRRNSAPVAINLPTPIYKNPEAKEKAEEELKRTGKVGSVESYIRDLLEGGKAVNKDEIPWYLPAMVGSGMVAAGGGYYVADKLLDRKRKADEHSEAEAARDRFREALIASYDPRKIPAAGVAKVASNVPDLGWELDKLADVMGVTDTITEKTALDSGRTAGAALGLYGTVAVPAALLAALGAYSYTKDRSSEELLEAALIRRQREQVSRRPSDIVVVRDPVHLSQSGKLTEDKPSRAVNPGSPV